MALSYALKYPDAVSGLVLLAPAAYPDRGNLMVRAAAHIPFVDDLAAFLGKSVLSHGFLKRELARAFYPQPVQGFVLRAKGELPTWKPHSRTARRRP